MQTTRRNVLKHGPAALVAMAAAGPVAADEQLLDAEALEVARLFTLIDDDATRASLHWFTARVAGIAESDPSLKARFNREDASCRN